MDVQCAANVLQPHSEHDTGPRPGIAQIQSSYQAIFILPYNIYGNLRRKGIERNQNKLIK